MSAAPDEWKVYNDHPTAPDIYYVRTSPSLYLGEVAVIFSHDNAAAHARLIAAAPELLAALKVVREWMDNPEVNPECPFGVSAASAIRIAIAKAEGRS